MTRESCQLYLKEPEANASHLAECAVCRELAETLASRIEAPAVQIAAMPLAPWEGASHRSWPLVAMGVIAVAVIAALLFAAAGTSPLQVLRGNVPSTDVVASLLRLAGGAVRNAPVAWQVGIAILFIVINAIFFALLRRAPRGLDA